MTKGERTKADELVLIFYLYFGIVFAFYLELLTT